MSIKEIPNGEQLTLLSRWFSGKYSYLWITRNDTCLGMVSGQKLYRLAKAIVKQFEEKRR